MGSSVKDAGGGKEEQQQQLESPLLEAAVSSGGGDGGGGHGVSGELESILGDETVPWARRMWAATGVEMRLMLRLAAPAVLVYMINYLMSMSTQIFSGHLGTLELAAASLGNTGIQVFAYGLMVRTSNVYQTRSVNRRRLLRS
jgi:MATE family multidrug resistance protein